MNQIAQSPEFLLRMTEIEQQIKNSGSTEEIKPLRHEPNVAEGNFVSIVVSATFEPNARSKYGVNHKIIATFLIFRLEPDGIQEEVEINQTYWQSSSPRSLYCRQLSKILGRNARDGFRMNELIGKAVEVTIKHNHTKSGTYANVSDIKLMTPNPDPIEIQI